MCFAEAAEHPKTKTETVNEKHLPTVYEQICTSYHAIDDFRAKLLALLPFATGAGIFLLLNKDAVTADLKPFFGPIGLFGFVITLGLFAYEIYGIRKCHALIVGGKQSRAGFMSLAHLQAALAKCGALSMNLSHRGIKTAAARPT